MAKQIFKDTYGKGNLSLNECKLDKTLLDYDSRSCLLYTSPSPRD